MKKKILIATVFIVVVLLTLTMVACSTVTDVEVPLPWNDYIDEVVSCIDNTFSAANGRYSMKFVVNLRHVIDNVATTFTVKFNITQDPNNPSKSALEVLGIANNEKIYNREIFYLGATNSNLYIKVQSLNSDDIFRYNFENTPIFELISFNFINPETSKQNILSFLNKIITGCDVNSDKSIYTLDCDFAQLIEGILPQWEDVLKLLPKPLIEQINSLFNTDINKWYQVLVGTTAKLNIKVSNYKVVDISLVDIKSPIVNIESKIEKIDVSEISVSKNVNGELVGIVNQNKSQYIRTKIGTFSMVGNIYLQDSTTSRNAVKYEYELNSSLDLIELINNNFDFSVLDDRNYFHFRLSHVCTNSCTAFCSVEEKNKLMASQGAVVDIAFSPKDFGTNYFYLSLGIKSLIGDNSLKIMAGANANLLNIFMGDYILITLDTSAYATGGSKEITTEIIKSIMGLATFADIGKKETILDIESIFAALKLQNNEFVNSLFDCGGYKVDRLKITYNSPQFGYVVDYEIDRETLHIIDYKNPDTKKYTSILGKADPSLKWEFYEKDMVDVVIDGKTVSKPQHKIYNRSTLVSGKGVPISVEEVQNLKGHYLNYTYTNIYGKTGDTMSGQARIISVSGLNPKLYDKYQLVTLKVSLPSKWMDSNIGSQLGSTFDEIMCATVETAIKLTKLNTTKGMEINRTDRDAQGKLVTDYRIGNLDKTPMLNGVFIANYANGEIKQIPLTGTCDLIRIQNGILGATYSIVNAGETQVKFNYAGKSAIFDININRPDEVSLVHNTIVTDIFNSNVDISESNFVLFKLQYKYVDSTVKTINVPMDNYTIKGESLITSSKSWTTYQEVDGKRYINFAYDGVYEVSLNMFDKQITRNITVTSRIISDSRYQIIDENNKNQLYKGYFRDLNYSLKNVEHGANGITGQYFELRIEQAYVNSAGNLSYKNVTSLSGIYEVKGLKYNGIDYSFNDKTNLIDIPATIFKPIPIKYSIQFNVSGIYRVSIDFANTRHTKIIEVLEAY